MQINWTTVQKKVDDLLPAEYNPRRMTDEQAAQLEKSLTKFGLAEIPAINTDGKMHQNVLIFVKGDAKKATSILPAAPFYEDPSADELSED